MRAKCREGRGTRPLDPMRKWARVMLPALVIGVAALTPSHAQQFAGYSELADAPADVAAALTEAKAQNKRVLIIFGANWCPDCRALDGMAREGKLQQVLHDSYVVVHADVGRFDKNLDLASRFGLDAKRGIPAIVVARAAEGTLEVADGRIMDKLMKGGADTLAAHFTVRE